MHAVAQLHPANMHQFKCKAVSDKGTWHSEPSMKDSARLTGQCLLTGVSKLINSASVASQRRARAMTASRLAVAKSAIIAFVDAYAEINQLRLSHDRLYY